MLATEAPLYIPASHTQRKHGGVHLMVTGTSPDVRHRQSDHQTLKTVLNMSYSQPTMPVCFQQTD